MKKRTFLIFKFLISNLGFLIIVLFSFEAQGNSNKNFNSKNIARKAIRSLKIDELKNDLINFVTSFKNNRSIFDEKGNTAAVNWISDKLVKSTSKGIVKRHVFAPEISYAKALYESDFKREIVGKYKPNSPEYKKWSLFNSNLSLKLDKIKSKTFENIIYERINDPNAKTILIYAHLDNLVFEKKTLTVNESGRNQGANDNGSGVISAIKLIEYLEKLDFKGNLIVLFSNFQEIGFLGMKAFIKEKIPEYKSKGIIISNSINLLMIGRDNKFQDKTKKTGNFKIYIQKPDSVYEEEIKNFFKAAKDFKRGIQLSVLANNFKFSDNVPLWEAGIPSFVISHDWENDTNEKEIHTSNDILETLNLSSLNRLTQYITAAIYFYLSPTPAKNSTK